jgi:hypothetical protein
MRNGKRVKPTLPKTPARNEWSRYRWYGCHDYKDGLGYRKDYETWTPNAQLNYEIGRATATVCKHEWNVIPDWNPNLDINTFMHREFDRETCDALCNESNYHTEETRA